MAVDTSSGMDKSANVKYFIAKYLLSSQFDNLGSGHTH